MSTLTRLDTNDKYQRLYCKKTRRFIVLFILLITVYTNRLCSRETRVFDVFHEYAYFSVCLSVCHACISRKLHIRTSPNFLCMVTVVMAWSFSGGVAICYTSGFVDDVIFSHSKRRKYTAVTIQLTRRSSTIKISSNYICRCCTPAAKSALYDFFVMRHRYSSAVCICLFVYVIKGGFMEDGDRFYNSHGPFLHQIVLSCSVVN